MKDQFVELVHKRIQRISPGAFVKNPTAALWLITAEVRYAHPLLYAKHRAIELLQRFRR